MNGLLSRSGQVRFRRRWNFRRPLRKFLPAIADFVVRLLEMSHRYLHRPISIPALHGVDDCLMGRYNKVAEVVVSDIAVEEKDVNLGPQSGPCVVEAAVPTGAIHDVVELEIEFGRFLLRNTPLHQLGDPVNDTLEFGDILLGRILDAALDRQPLDRDPKRVDLVEILAAELGDKRATNDQMRGFWMIRPDGTRAPVTDYFIELWNRR